MNTIERRSPSLFCVFALAAAAFLATALSSPAAKLGYTEQLPIETFKKLREVERHQIQTAEKIYLREDYAAAANEYEKFLTLYEASPAAPYAQLMWSHCLVRQRKANTAIRDGFQSVIDYWPDSNEAVLAAYLIGTTNLDMGYTAKSKKAFLGVIEDHSEHHVAFLSKTKLLELATIANDDDVRVTMLKELTFDTPRTDKTKVHCAEASKKLASHYFYDGNFDDGVKAFETTYKGYELVRHIWAHTRSPIHHLTAKAETEKKGEAVLEKAIQRIDEESPDDISEEGPRKRAKDYAFWKADLYGHARKGAERLKVYEQMVKSFGVDDNILGHIAEWYIGAKRDEEATKIFGKFKDQIEGQRRIVKLWRDRGKFKEAIEGYQGLIQIDPDRVGEYQWAVAECYWEISDYKKAIGVYRQCDNYPEVYYRMAACHRKLKQYKEALVLYNQAKGHHGHAPRATLDIGFTYEQAGEKEKAIKTFQTTCRSWPKSGQASRAHAHLQNKYKISVTLGGATDK